MNDWKVNNLRNKTFKNVYENQKMFRKSLLFILCVSFFSLQGQSDIAIGEWVSYLPHQEGLSVTQSTDKIIYATEQSIFTIDKDEFSIDYLSKVNGLTDTGISEITYDSFNDQLVIAYENSIIDIVSGNDVFPVFDLKNNTSFIDRRVNDLFVQNERWLYIATGFGLLQYDLQNLDFGFTLDAGQKVDKVNGNSERLAILAEDSIYVLDFQNALFPNAFSTWIKVDDAQINGEKAVDLLVYNSSLYILTESSVYKSSDFANFQEVYTINDSSFKGLFIKEGPQSFIVGFKDGSSNSRLEVFDDMDILIDEVSSCTNRILDAVIDDKGRIFFADEWNMIRYIDESGMCQRQAFEGPFSSEATDFSIKDDVIYVASGGITENFADLFGRKGIYILEEGEWNNINQDNNSFYRENDLLQFYQIEVHPTEPKLYIGTFWGGLVEQNLETGEQVVYTEENTGGILLPQVGNEQRTKIGGLAFDQDENLWISSFGASRPLAVLSSEGSWHNFPINADTRLTDLVIDDAGFVWGVIGGNTGGVIVYDAARTVNDPTDDRPSKLFNLNNSEIPSNLVNSIAKDEDGTIWVGTAAGVVAFDCGGGVFEDNCIGNKRKVVQDSIVAFLLETEDVQAIAVDGGNRKWFGTRNGIFVQSPSGEEQVAKFDIDNSPLFDNNIKSMAFNGNTGEMFIASNRGIQAIRTETTTGRVNHLSNVYAFPNPVEPDYNGVIAIKGLARDADVKITDVDGQLVFQTQALGGQAIWNGTDQTGREVSGGVYLVFSSSTDQFRDPNTFVTKILVVR